MNTNSPNPAALGALGLARECLARGDFKAAWLQCIEAIHIRPFHPEGVLLAGEIAMAAHDAETARVCMERVRRMAPQFAEARAIATASSGCQQPGDWPGLGEITQTRPLRLSVCMIVKNEEAFLEKCLQSVSEIASQIILVDTGSTDRTVEIAHGFKAEVYHHEWNDDFSAARNAALLHARGDWILVLDADEELTPGAAQRLMQEINVDSAIAYELPLVNEGREEEGAVYVPRLFRNVPGAFYEGRVHEQIVPGLLEKTRGWGLQSRVSQAVLLHHGYSKAVTATRNKPERNLRLLQKSLQNPPADPVAKAFLYSYLGLETVRTGDLAGGITHYERALELLNEFITSRRGGVSISPAFRASFLHQFAPYLNRAGRYRDVIRLFESPLARGGELSASDHYILGLALGQAGEYEKARREFESCIAKRRSATLVPNHAVVLGHAPFQCLALVLVELRRPADAEKTYQRGLAELPQSLELHLEYARFKFQQGRVVDALRDIHAIVNAHPENTAAWLFGAEICLGQAQLLEIAMDWTAGALQKHPDDSAIVAMRAEALLLSQDSASAVSIAANITASAAELDGRTVAVVVFCRLLEPDPELPQVDPPKEPHARKAFLDLYQRVGIAGGTSILEQLNLDRLATALPLASKAIKEIRRKP